jgi:hypothetical protein
MGQFFKVGDRQLNLEQMVAWRAEQNYKNRIFCEYCVTKAVKHLKDCPTKQPDFNPETAHKLTIEERELLIAQKNGSNTN